ncbi:presenilins-associated rhomboid-like protein, mitochondrial [Triplophysa rosa]|uniref:rhomboid protease n=1 Tax=Triplophysa rosa TaxID=992332 RepID=A0A9W7WWV8_TRIRA|nr:presenilins-associated rhomboid-like protein, mitochondrial [Triplophysa rosa]KAI7810137.1 presenilins-associated rhomboid-like protein [Triplophysa rosa]
MAWRTSFNQWTKLDAINRSSLFSKNTRCTFHPQQRCGFRKAQRQVETKRCAPEEADAGGYKDGVRTQPRAPVPLRKPDRLFRPLVFTVAFTGCSFGAAAIFQYESVKSRVQMAMEEENKEQQDELLEACDTTYWHNWWNQLSDFQKQVILVMSGIDEWWSGLSEGQKTVTGIIAINSVVLCCWRIPSMQRTMVKYFTSNPASRTRCFPMVLSSFSHYSIIHMMANMYVLWTFSTSIVSLLGKEQFLALYLSGGVISTFASYVFKTSTRRLGPSLGASGAIMTILAAVCTKIPEAKLGIILLPVVSFSAGNALKAVVAMDTAGLLLGWRFFDHAAHLGGALFGVWYTLYGNEMIWRKREPLVKFWHALRNGSPGRAPPGGGGGQV